MYSEVDSVASEMTDRPILVNIQGPVSNSEVVQNNESSDTIQRAITSSDLVCCAAPPSIGKEQLCLEHHKPIFLRNLVNEDIQTDFADQVQAQTRSASDVTLPTAPDKLGDTFSLKKYVSPSNILGISKASSTKIWQKYKKELLKVRFWPLVLLLEKIHYPHKHSRKTTIVDRKIIEK